MSEATEELRIYCREHEVRRFSADEVLELLEDGETVDWIMDQILPASTPDSAAQLRGVLERLAEELGPDAVATDGDPAAIGGEAASMATGPDPGPSTPVPDMGDLRELLPPGVDVEQLEAMLSSPRGELMADFGAFCQERGAGGGEPAEAMQAAMHELHAEWLATPRDSLEGKRPAELLGEGGLFPPKVETMRRETPKIGRNDPCPCGSGKKYKKCCGKGAT